MNLEVAIFEEDAEMDDLKKEIKNAGLGKQTLKQMWRETKPVRCWMFVCFLACLFQGAGLPMFGLLYSYMYQVGLQYEILGIYVFIGLCYS